MHVRHSGWERTSATSLQRRLPLSLGGVGLRSAVRTSNSAFWGSWVYSLPLVRERHPEVVDMIVAALDELVGTRSRGAGFVSGNDDVFLTVARARCESALLSRREIVGEPCWRVGAGGGDGDSPLLSDVLSDFSHAGSS